MQLQKRRRPWTEDEIVTLLAYLDYYVKKQSDLGAYSIQMFPSKLASHLKQRSSKQVVAKLSSLMIPCDAAPSPYSYNDIFVHGSKCFPHPSSGLRLRIQDEVKAIEIDEQNRFLNTPQTLRNGKKRSVSVDVGQQSPSRNLALSSRRCTTRKKRLTREGLRASVSIPHEQSRNTSETSSLDHQLSLRKKLMRSQMEKEGFSSTDDHDTLPRDGKQKWAGARDGSSTAEVADSVAESSEEEPEQILVASQETYISSTTDATCSTDDAEVSSSVHAEKVDDHLIPSKISRTLSKRCERYRRRYKELKKRLGVVEEQIRLEKSLKECSKDPNWSQFAEIHSKEQQIKDLERRLAVHEKQKRSSNPSPADVTC